MRCSGSFHTASLQINAARYSARRAFPIVAAQGWNDLLRHVTSAPSMRNFCTRLKTYLFCRSFPDDFMQRLRNDFYKRNFNRVCYFFNLMT